MRQQEDGGLSAPTGAAGQRAAAPVPADPRTGYLLNRYQHAQVIMVAPVAGGVALAAVLNAAQLGIWAALAVSLAVAIAALMYPAGPGTGLRQSSATSKTRPPRRSALARPAPAHPPWAPHAPASATSTCWP